MTKLSEYFVSRFNWRTVVSHACAIFLGVLLGLPLHGLINKWQLNKSIEKTELQIGQNPESPTNWLVLGMLRARRGDNDGALAAYTKALALDPSSIDALRALGVFYTDQGNLVEAEKWFTEALNIARTKNPGEVYQSEQFLNFIEAKKRAATSTPRRRRSAGEPLATD